MYDLSIKPSMYIDIVHTIDRFEYLYYFCGNHVAFVIWKRTRFDGDLVLTDLIYYGLYS